MRTRLGFLLVLLVACGGGGGGDDDLNTTDIPDACNPLGGQGCMLPWPSMVYAREDATSATGFRVDIPVEATPTNVDGIAIDPTPLNRWDGFSRLAPILAAFPTGVSPDGLPTFKDPAESLAPGAPVVLIDMATGARTPLFAEVDQNVADVTKRDLIIRPLAKLAAGARYVVAIRDTVKAADGGALPVPPGFAALRDGGTFGHPRWAALQPRYEQIFATLEDAGIARDELVLAWDFVTASDEYVRGDLTTMREAALGAIGTDGANLTFTATEQPNTPRTFKRYLGTFTSPSFLSNGEADASVIVRDADARPALQGMRDANFAAIIPKCVETQPLPRPTIIFGHGLFGSSEEYLSDGFVEDLAEQHCFVIIAGDFIGLTSRQLALAPLAVNDFNKGIQITEKLAQSVIDFIALESIARGPMKDAPEFEVGGQPVIDPAQVFYVGGSLGGIMGNTIMAYDPNLTRGVLAVPGGNWSLLLERSTAWSLLLGAAQGAYPDPEVYQLNLSMMLGMGFEPVDPMTTADHVIKDPLFGNPVKNILIWYALGDCLVTNISTEMVARTMGIDMLAPSIRSPFELAPIDGPRANGMTVLDDHPTPLPPDTNVPPAEDNGTHSGINRKAAVLREVEAFLIGGQATQGCELDGQPAPCDCATGACD